MATHTLTVFTDDITGQMLHDGEYETIRFTIGHDAYTLDLSLDNAAQFRAAIAPYIEAASKASAKPPLANVRKWAKSQGYQVSARGRIHSDIMAAYQAAHR